MFDFLHEEDGQGLVEYGIIIGLIALAIVAAGVLLGSKIREVFFKAGEALSSKQ